jgi:hypothetical protein
MEFYNKEGETIQVWWAVPVILVTPEVEAGRSWVGRGQPGQSETLSQKATTKPLRQRIRKSNKGDEFDHYIYGNITMKSIVQLGYTNKKPKYKWKSWRDGWRACLACVRYCVQSLETKETQKERNKRGTDLVEFGGCLNIPYLNGHSVKPLLA